MPSHYRKRRRQPKAASSKNPLPHILLLMTDQLRHDALDALVTPNLYQWATNVKTTLFQNAYSSTPTCTPARAALLTGKSPWHHGLLGYAPAVDCEDYPTTLPSILAKLLNYQTVVVGKNHFGTKPCKDQENRQSTTKGKIDTAKDCRTTERSDGDYAQKRRFVDHGYQNMTLYDGLNAIPDDYDEYFQDQLPGINPLATCGLGWNDWRGCPYVFDEEFHPTAWTTRTALQTLDRYMGRNNHNTTFSSSSKTNHDDHRPVFLKVSYHRPHSPYDPPKRLFDKHLARSKLSNQIYARNLGNHNTSWDAIYASRDDQEDGVLPPNAWHGDPGESKARKSRAAYLANTEFVDEGVGTLFQKLQTLGLWDQTLVIWVSDHGDMNGDHYLWRKGYPWEASSHINLVVKLPEQQAEKAPVTTSDALVELRDVAPTIYDFLGILDTVTTFLDPMVDGKSLLPILTNKTSFLRSSLNLEHSTLYDKSIHWNAIVGKRNITPQQQQEQSSLQYYSTTNRRTNARNSTNNSLFHSDGKDWNCALAKYIFFASTGQEQFFCLSNDPHEVIDLASDPDYASLLAVWRAKLVQQFQTEGRGEHWVTMDGKLVARPEGRVYGPHYPCRQASKKKNNEFETNSIGSAARVDE